MSLKRERERERESEGYNGSYLQYHCENCRVVLVYLDIDQLYPDNGTNKSTMGVTGKTFDNFVFWRNSKSS